MGILSSSREKGEERREIALKLETPATKNSLHPFPSFYVLAYIVHISRSSSLHWFPMISHSIGSNHHALACSAVSTYYSDRSLRNAATSWVNASKLDPAAPKSRRIIVALGFSGYKMRFREHERSNYPVVD